MNCVGIVGEYLEQHRFDGLYGAGECGCLLSDFMPCEEDFSKCKPGYRIDAPPGCESDYYICASRDARPWEEE